MSKTFNRGQLLRLAIAGKLAKVSSYHFDDMYGSEQSDKELPVRIKSEHGDMVDGYCNLFSSDFKGKPGCAWENPNGTITLIVHSNCNFTFKRVDVMPSDRELASR